MIVDKMVYTQLTAGGLVSRLGCNTVEGKCKSEDFFVTSTKNIF